MRGRQQPGPTALGRLSAGISGSGLWRTVIFLLSSLLLAAVSLNFAIGVYVWDVFIGYFRHPMIFLLNWLPVLLLQMLLLALCGRQWLAFLLNSVLTLLPAIGNFYKLKFRNDPFVFADISSIRAGLAVAGDYDLRITDRIVLSLVFVLAGTIVLALLVRGRTGRRGRIAALLLALASVLPLWRVAYSNDGLYDYLAGQNPIFLTRDDRDKFRSTGFPYPFLHSIKAGSDLAPDGYDEAAAARTLEGFSSQPIPGELRPSILVVQLESFGDFEAMGVKGIADAVYAPLRQLQAESCTGNLIPNVIGGGTVNTERCVLCGTWKLLQYNHPAFSYARYLRSQGYHAVGSHPNVSSFYSRGLVNDYLGFEDYLYTDNYFTDISGWRCDSSYLPEVFRRFREEAESGQPVFSFNVTTQGHWPYEGAAYYDRDDYWQGDGVNDTTRYLLNNYFSLISETESILLKELDALRESPAPMIVLLYGDHKPWLTEETGLTLGDDDFYRDMGLDFDLDTEEGLLQYLSTPYLIWANDAAKELTGRDFAGEGPTVSPGYLMNVLFHEIGWEGPAYMQFGSAVMEHLPVIYTNGRYVEDGGYTGTLSPAGQALLQEFEQIQYYVHYRPELAE